MLGLQKKIIVRGGPRTPINDADKDVQSERASSVVKKHTLVQVQAEAEASTEDSRERKKRQICTYFEVTARRLQDVTNTFGTRVSLPPHMNVLGILSPLRMCDFR